MQFGKSILSKLMHKMDHKPIRAQSVRHFHFSLPKIPHIPKRYIGLGVIGIIVFVGIIWYVSPYVQRFFAGLNPPIESSLIPDKEEVKENEEFQVSMRLSSRKASALELYLDYDSTLVSYATENGEETGFSQVTQDYFLSPLKEEVLPGTEVGQKKLHLLLVSYQGNLDTVQFNLKFKALQQEGNANFLVSAETKVAGSSDDDTATYFDLPADVSTVVGIVGTGENPPATLRVIKAADHPNLYFSKAEIEYIQKTFRENTAPQAAITAFNKIKNTQPVNRNDAKITKPWPDNYMYGNASSKANFEATLSYLIQPTNTKADKLKTSLLSWTRPSSGGWLSGGQESGHVHFSLAFMYDALYNSGKLSASEKQNLDAWFKQISENTFMTNQEWVNSHIFEKNYEGSRRQGYANWWTYNMGSSIVTGLVSHDQSTIDKSMISSLPDDNYIIGTVDGQGVVTQSNISQYAPDSRTLKNILNGEVFPSGLTFDGYKRNYGYDPLTEPYKAAGQGQHYHFFATFPLVLAAEAADHNGFDAWAFNNHALKRSFVAGREFAPHAYRVEAGNHTKGRSYNWLPAYWIVYSNYLDDPDVVSAIQDSGSEKSLPYVINNAAPIWGALAKFNSPNPTPTPNPTEKPDTTPTATPIPNENSPTPTQIPNDVSPTPSPTASGGENADVELKLKVRFQGVTTEPTEAFRTLNTKVILASADKSYREEKTIPFVANEDAVWVGTFSAKNVPLDVQYAVFIKGPKHLMKKICVSAPTESVPGTYECSAGSIALKAGAQEMDTSKIVLLVGDIPTQDGIIDSLDASFVRNSFVSKVNS